MHTKKATCLALACLSSALTGCLRDKPERVVLVIEILQDNQIAMEYTVPPRYASTLRATSSYPKKINDEILQILKVSLEPNCGFSLDATSSPQRHKFIIQTDVFLDVTISFPDNAQKEVERLFTPGSHNFSVQKQVSPSESAAEDGP
jgi:hypothetical protein